MYKMTRRIYQALSQDPDLRVFTDETDSSTSVWLQFGIKNGGSYRIRFISRDDDNDVSVRVYALLSVEEDQYGKILPALNDINNDYRFFKFVLDEDGDVNLEYDYMQNCPDPAASAMEIVTRIVRIIDDVYPVLMRAMWA